MISLKRIVEQQGAEGQYYDLGKDFSDFRHTIDGSSDQIKQRFEQTIGNKLVGKRVRARASRGYKQYVKDYEFDVSKVTLDDYYDNYVVVAHDNTTPKAKEYFLKPGFKIQILGQASGQPTHGAVEQKPEQPPQQPAEKPVTPLNNPDTAQSQPMAPAGQEVKEDASGHSGYDAYSVDSIAQDIKVWLTKILLKPDTSIRDFIKGIGWLKSAGRGKSVAMFDLKIPRNAVKVRLDAHNLKQLVQSANKHGSTIDSIFDIVSAKTDEPQEEVFIRIKKTMTDKSSV